MPAEFVDRFSPATIAFAAGLDVVTQTSPAVAESILAELADQRQNVKLIAGENFASPAVLLAAANWLNDKSAEGVPGKRLYAGCQNVDDIEEYAVSRAKKLFAADHAYIQPHSGLDANLVAFWAILAHRVQNPAVLGAGGRNVDELSAAEWRKLRTELGNQRLLSMSLEAGGHLSHGVRSNITGKLFDTHAYGVGPSGTVDYTDLARMAREVRPLILLAGYSAYPRLLDFRILRQIADEVGATLMVDMAHFAGLVAGGALSGDHDPVRYADIVTTTTHKTLRGPRGGMVLCRSEFADAVDRGCPLVISAPIPQMMAAKAVALDEASTPEFRDYAHGVVANARRLAETLVARGVPVLTGGTDNHLVLVDVRPFGLTGRQAESALRSARLTCNRNTIPSDSHGRWYTSGLRFGTAALTTLGMGGDEMTEIGELIYLVLRDTAAVPGSSSRFYLDPAVGQSVSRRALALLERFPLYPGLDL
ncbi:aminotransferase class I/II-fold pyridoxal phosphate-dependent enzyme [Catellatospora chokoriensis]|uniref:aminotransferase class I/II-fold pyridoxal phosphate-dependent enzyme n=1 Tax=Catellatospora chokoriensis TaxID=310353 RepID=UPI001EF38C55|nr:aminotransferase class I/II-fold pyridoxal phosphate-dependent enzyme [Catellatospora chokoriensis]